MKIEHAKHIAKKYVKDEITVLELTRDIITAFNAGYKEAHEDINETLDRIQAGDPRKVK